MTLAEIIQSSVKKFSDKIFIIDKGDYTKNEHTYKEIYEKALKITNYFKAQKIIKGDKIITFMPNSSDYVSVIWACALSGVILIPLDLNSQTQFIEKIYSDTKAKQVFCSIYKYSRKTKNFFVEEMNIIYENYSPKYLLEKIKKQDIFEIVYTSGTTSDPKGVVLTHENLKENVLSMISSITHSTKRISMLSILPLSHLLEQNVGLFNPIVLGTKITYLNSKKTSKIIGTIKEEKINTIVTVPLFLEFFRQRIIEEMKEHRIEDIKQKNFLIRKLINYQIKQTLWPLKTFIVGGSALNIETEKFWREAGFMVLQGYGLTETSPVLTCNSSKNNKLGSAGKPLKNIEIKIENGEIIARGKNVFKGYYQNSEETKKTLKNNWIYTGDLGKIDEEGYLFITGRKKNVIISDSGLNIYPEDIEKKLNSENQIKASVVLGLNNGKDLVAVILQREKINEELFRKKINEKLPDNQKLTKIIIWPEKDFPRTATMKIIRGKVEEQIRTNKYELIEPESGDKLLSLVSIICKISPEKIKETSNLSELGLDSIKRIELITKIEEELNVDFEEDDINESTTIRSLRNSIKKASYIKRNSEINFLNSHFFNPLRFLFQEISFLGLAPFLKIKTSGIENLPKEKCILISNHQSLLDTFAIYKSLPIKYRLNTCPTAAKDFFFKKKTVGLLAKLTFNAFAFSRKGNPAQSMKDTGKLLDAGNNILIYPEGTRSRSGKMAEFKEGIGIIAKETNLPIVPIKIKGLHEILPVGAVWPKRGNVEIKIGKPIRFNKMNSPQEITKILHDEIGKL